MAFCDDCGTGDHWTKNCPKPKKQSPMKKARKDGVAVTAIAHPESPAIDPEDTGALSEAAIETAEIDLVVCAHCRDKALVDYLNAQRVKERRRKKDYRGRQKK